MSPVYLYLSWVICLYKPHNITANGFHKGALVKASLAGLYKCYLIAQLKPSLTSQTLFIPQCWSLSFLILKAIGSLPCRRYWSFLFAHCIFQWNLLRKCELSDCRATKELSVRLQKLWLCEWPNLQDKRKICVSQVVKCPHGCKDCYCFWIHVRML